MTKNGWNPNPPPHSWKKILKKNRIAPSSPKHRPLAVSAARLMYLRVHDSRDSSRQPAPSPSPFYPFTHTHRSIGYHNLNPQSLTVSTERLIHLRVYDSRDSSRHPAPSPSLYYSLTHAHNTLPTPISCCVTTRTRLTLCLPTQPSVCEAF